MKTMKIWRLAFAMLATFSLASCSSDDDNEDKVEQVTVYVSAETGVYYDMWLDPERENPIIGMQIREEGNSTWRTVSIYTITGFTYKKGNEYELLVKKTTLANPPQDSGNVRYELISIVSQRKIEYITPVPMSVPPRLLRGNELQGGFSQ